MEARLERRIGLCDPGMTPIDGMGLAPLLDLDFTQGRHYAHRSVVSSALTFTRASSALDYSVQPAVLRATNEARYMQNSAIAALNGILIEGADTNLCVRNEYSSSLDTDWTETNLVMETAASPNLYNGGSIYITYFGGDAYHYQTKLLTAVKYIVSALVYIDPAYGAISTQMQMAAGAAGAIAGLTTSYEHLGNDVYLCWAVFTATAANWDIGFKFTLPGFGALAYHSCLTCHIAAPANEGGDFPRSPIPNDTGASKTRAADVLTIPADGNIGTTTGTIDVEFIVPCALADAGADLVIYDVYKDANNRIFLYFSAAFNEFRFLHLVGGTVIYTASTPALVRGQIVKVRCLFGADISGLKDLITYMSISGGAWSELASDNGPLGGSMPAGSTINIGRYGTGTGYFSCLIRRIRIKAVAELNPSW